MAKRWAIRWSRVQLLESARWRIKKSASRGRKKCASPAHDLCSPSHQIEGDADPRRVTLVGMNAVIQERGKDEEHPSLRSQRDRIHGVERVEGMLAHQRG